MKFERDDNIKDSCFLERCESAKIKGGILKVSARCYDPEKKWIGLALSYNYKIEEDKETIFIPVADVRKDREFTQIYAEIDLRQLTLKMSNWSVNAVFEEAGERFAAGLAYRKPKMTTLDFLFAKDSCVKDDKIIFCYRNIEGHLGIRIRELSRYDGFMTRFREVRAVSSFKKHKEELDKERIYLIYEKLCKKAQDNGYYLFKYCMENDMEKYLDARIYYVMEKDAADRGKLRKYENNVLDFMSPQFMEKLLAANLLISPDSRFHAYQWQSQKSLIASEIRKKKHVFLGHGELALKRLNDSFHADNMKSTLCTVTSEREKRIVRDELGFPEERVVTTGYARFDALRDTSGDTKEILVMPTHRSWLFEVDREVFTGSNYYERYMELINSDVMTKLLEDNDIKLSFYLHPSIREQLGAFSTNSDMVHIVDYDEAPLDDLMMRSKMLITDYSSICWDMYYMDKPTVFYQFDKDEYMETWGSYIDFEKDLPGDMVKDLGSLIQVLKSYIDTDFVMKPVFEEGRQNHFLYTDDNNCRRICEVLKERNYW